MRTSSDMPDQLVSPETGETLRRGTRPFPVTYKGETIFVDLPGYYGDADGDGVLVGDDMKAADEALRLLKERLDGIPTPATIRRIRQKLRLSQRDAGRVFKVGESAFDKYERGLIQPSGPTAQLMVLLDRHPDLLEELR